MERLFRSTIFVSLLSIAVPATALPPRNIDLSELLLYPEVQFEAVHGTNQTLKMPNRMANIGYGAAPVILVRLPVIEKTKTALLSSYEVSGGFFYPIIVFADEHLKPLHEVRRFPDVHKTSYAGVKQEFELELYPEYRYLIITTDPELAGKELDYSFRQGTSSSMYINGYIVPVASGSYTITNSVKYGTEAKLHLSIPRSRQKRAQRNQDGFYINFGVNFGGETAAYNPDGDQYNVGGGAILGLGFAWQPLIDSNIILRLSGGFRIQGGDGGNEGKIIDIAALSDIGPLYLGGGMHWDRDSRITNTDGFTTQFKPASGPTAFIEYKQSDTLNLRLMYTHISYESEFGEVFVGNTITLDMNLWFF